MSRFSQRDPGDETHADRVVDAALAGKITAAEAQRLLFPPTDREMAAVLCLVCAQQVDVSGLGIRDDDTAMAAVVRALQDVWIRNYERHAKCGHN